MADVTLTELIDMLSELFTNMNNLDRLYYDMFFNTTPMDLTLQRYDENGVLQTYVIPNRAKDAANTLTGMGNPEGQVVAPIGKLYIDLETGELYYKSSNPATNTGWELVYTKNVGTFQDTSEKGQPNGYAGLDENGKIPLSELPVTETDITYSYLGQDTVIDIVLEWFSTTVTVECSNPDLTVTCAYDGTETTAGTTVVVLEEKTRYEYTLQESLVTVNGTPDYDDSTGIMSNFSADNYATIPVDTILNFKFDDPTDLLTAQNLLHLSNKDFSVVPMSTTLSVTSSNPALIITNSYNGQKTTTGTEVVELEYETVTTINTALVTSVGSPTIVDGVVTNFTVGNYLSPALTYTSTKTLVVNIITCDDITSTQGIVGIDMSIAIKNGYLGYNSSNNTFVNVLQVEENTPYWLKMTYDSENSINQVEYSTDGENFTRIVTDEEGGGLLLGSYALGKANVELTTETFAGSIDLVKCYIDNNGTISPYATQASNWYLDGVVVNLNDYAISVSGTPVRGDVLTLTYTTSPAHIGSKAIETGVDYWIRLNHINSEETVYYTKQFLAHTVTTGTLTDDDNVVSGFSTADYLGFPANYINFGSGKWILLLKVITSTDVSTRQAIFGDRDASNFGVFVENGNFGLLVDSNETRGSHDITTGTTYFIKVEFDGTDYKLSWSSDNTTYTTDITYTSSLTPGSSTYTLGIDKDDYVWTGSIDLQGCALQTEMNGQYLPQIADDLATNNFEDIEEPFATTDTTMSIGTSFLGIVSMKDSYSDSLSLCLETIHYDWYAGSTLINLEDYELTVEGTPETGDTITLTYVTIKHLV